MKFFSLIFQGELHPAKGKKILRKEEYSTMVTAEEVLEKAKEDSAALLKKAELDAIGLRKKAEEEGYDEGLSRFNEHLVRFDQEIARLRHEMQQMVLPLVIKASQKIVGKQLELNPETIVDIVMQALAPAVQNHRITIFVNKEDKDILEANKPRLKEILEQVDSFSIQERADVEKGGCIIVTEAGIINATMENQWRALEAAFNKYMKPQA
ncbi:MAG TPA: HrpE/YscL family type III secretion apparatus protein [Rhabdochlamydiaceae bacterium]